MKTKEPIVAKYNNNLIPYLKSYIVDKLEEENNLDVLEKIYSIISPESKMSFEQKFALAKEQTEKADVDLSYAVWDKDAVAKELEAEGYMIDKPYPFMDSTQDLEEAIQDDEKDENAPQEWITKMFPELHV